MAIETNSNSELVIRLEFKILGLIIKNQTKTENKIAKAVCLDTVIVSQLITNLMSKGYIERARRRRLLFFSRDYFYITIDGIAALESATRFYDPWNEIVGILKEQVKKIFFSSLGIR